MIRHIQISGSELTAVQQVFTAMPELSASITVSGSLSQPIINTYVSYETTESIVSIAKYMSLSCSYMDDLGTV